MQVLCNMRQARLLQQAIPRAYLAAPAQQHHGFALAAKCVAAASVAEQQRMYIVDLMPYVYKGLHRSTAEEQAAVPAPQQRQQQQQQQQQSHNTQWKGAESMSAADVVISNVLNILCRTADPATHMAIVVDVPGPTFRHLMYPQYKGTRPERPEDLQHELSCILSVLDAAGISVLAVPGVEADDVAGTLAQRAAAAAMQVVLVSSDRDFYQLLQPNVCILSNPSGGSAPLYTQSDFLAEYGLSDPKLWIDVKALAGDAGDNIPGVKSIGQKTALQLVQQYGSVENILQCYAATDKPQQVKLNKRQLEMLGCSDGAVAAKFAKQLVTIVTDLKHPPVRQPLDSFKLRLPPNDFFTDEGSAAVKRASALNLTWSAGRLQKLFEDMSMADDRPLDL